MSSGNKTSEDGGDGGTSNNNNTASTTTSSSNTSKAAPKTATQYPQLEDKVDFAIVKWLAGFEPDDLPESLSSAFRLGPLQDKLKITKPIVWLANLSCDFKSAYDTIDDPHDVFGPTLGGRRRASDGKRTYPRPFTAGEKKRFELLQDEYHNQRWQNLLLLGYDPATAATMVGALRDKHMRVFSPPPLFTLSPRMIVTDEEKRMKMKAIVMGYLDGLAKQAEKELLEDLDREFAEEQQQQGNGGNNNSGKGKNAKKKAKKKAAAAKKKAEISSTSGDSTSQPPSNKSSTAAAAAAAVQPPTPPAATKTNETVAEKRRRIEFAVAEARRKQNEAEQLKLQQKENEQQQDKEEKEEEDDDDDDEGRPSTPGPLSPDQMKYLREQQQKNKPKMLEKYDEKDRQIIREALERTGLKEEDVTKDVTNSSDKDGKGMPYAWCCDFCKTATFPTFAEAALHETTCPERPKTEEEMEAFKAALKEEEKESKPAKAKRGVNIEIDLELSLDDINLGKRGGGLPKSSTRQRGTFAAKRLADKSKDVNIAELMESLALEWSERKEKELSKKSKKVDNDTKSAASSSSTPEKTSSPIIPSVDYSDDESDSDDDLNLEQFVKSAPSKATPAKKAPIVAPVPIRPKIVEMSSHQTSEKPTKQPPSEKESTKALSKKEKKKAAAAAKKEKKKAAAASAAPAPTSNPIASKESSPTNKQKKVASPAVVDKPVKPKELAPPQSRPPPGLVRQSPVPMEMTQLKAMKSSTLDYSDRVNDTALPQPPAARESPTIPLDQSSDLFIMQNTPSPTPHISPPPHQAQLQATNISSPLIPASTSRPLSPSVINRISSLTADNEVLTAKANFLETENKSLRAEIEALRNQMTIDRQNAVEALQRVQLKSYISDTAKDAAEERAAWLEAVLVDAVAELTTREVVRIETDEAIKAVSYAAVQPNALPSSYHSQQMQPPPPQRTSVLPPLGDVEQLSSTVSPHASHRSTNRLDSFSFEGDLNLGHFSAQTSGGILPQAPWPRDEGVFARLRRGDDA